MAVAAWGSWAGFAASQHSEQANRDAQAGRLDLAAVDIRQALSLRPNDPELLRQASSLYGSLAFFQAGKGWSEQGVATARKAALHGQQDARNFFALGWALQDAGRTPQAEAAFLAALDRDPYNQADLYALGLLYETSGRPALALGQYRAALKIRPDVVLEAALTRLGAIP